MKEHPGSGLLLGAAGAFTFVLSALKIPSVTGSTSHPTGTGFGAVLFKPPVMALLGTIVLVFQALLLAHGGVTTLGANVFSMAIVGPWVGYAGYVLTRKLGGGLLPGVFVAAFLADLSTYVVTAGQLAFAHPADPGGFAGAYATFMGLFAVTQIPLAVIEALLTVLIVRALTSVAAQELQDLGVLRGLGGRRLGAPRNAAGTVSGGAADAAVAPLVTANGAVESNRVNSAATK